MDVYPLVSVIHYSARFTKEMDLFSFWRFPIVVLPPKRNIRHFVFIETLFRAIDVFTLTRKNNAGIGTLWTGIHYLTSPACFKAHRNQPLAKKIAAFSLSSHPSFGEYNRALNMCTLLLAAATARRRTSLYCGNVISSPPRRFVDSTGDSRKKFR
jgi:hypothetical protein